MDNLVRDKVVDPDKAVNPNEKKSVRMQITLDPFTAEAIGAMLNEGLLGNTKAEIVNVIVKDWIINHSDKLEKLVTGVLMNARQFSRSSGEAQQDGQGDL